MKEITWSASRIGTYKGCALRYYYTYVNKFISNVPVNTVYADKGTVFHNTVEKWASEITDKEKLKELLQKNCKKFNIIDGDPTPLSKDDPKKIQTYNESRALEVFFTFWEKWVQPKLDKGYSFKQEIKFNPLINNKKFTGALDLLIEPKNKNDLIYVVDYKSGADIHVEDYRLQQILYAYFLGDQRGWDIPTTASKVKLYIFGPFSEKKRAISEEDKMLSCMKEIKYSAQEMQEIIDDYMSTITEINTIDWENVDADKLGTYSHKCTWCPFLGSIARDDFKGCKCSYDKGFRQSRGVVFSKP